MKSSLNLSLLILSLFAFNACIKSEDGDGQLLGNSTTIKVFVSKSQILAGESVKIYIESPDLYTNITWALVHESGMLLKDCASSTGELNCTFDEAGKIQITASAKTREGDSAAGVNSLTVIDPASPQNQPPRLLVEVKDKITGSLKKVIASDVSLESGSLNLPQGEYVLDFSKTLDDKDRLSDLKFEISFDGVRFDRVSTVSLIKFDTVKIYNIWLRAYDTSNNMSERRAVAYIKCGTSVPALNISSASITVTPQTKRNYFNYNVNGVSGGSGSSSYNYSWDFNGDKVFDSVFSSQPSALNIYSHHAGNRRVQVQIWDKTCNYFASVTKDVNFDIYMEDTSFAKAPATREQILASIDGMLANNESEYYFLQGSLKSKLSSQMSSMGHLQDFKFAAHQYLKDSTEPKRVICDYRKEWVVDGDKNGSPKASFTISALNKYSRPESRNQGISLRVSNIMDPNGTTGGSTIDTSAATITEVAYYTDGGQDQAQAFQYSRSTACSLTMKVVPKIGTSPCSTTGGESQYGVQILGVFSCPTLTTGSYAVDMASGDGAFFCEVENIDACVGGGGAAPGIPPLPR